MENAFTYIRSIKSINDALAEFGPRLTDAYSYILGRYANRFFTALKEILPSYAYLENFSVPSLGLEQQMGINSTFSRVALSAGLTEEYIAIELSRRVLQYLGFQQPVQLQEMEELSRAMPSFKNSLEELIRKPNDAFVKMLVETGRLKAGYEDDSRYLESLQKLNVIKRKPKKNEIEQLGNMPISVLGYENDNFFLALPYINPKNAGVTNDGRFVYYGNIITFPVIGFSEEGIQKQGKNLDGSGIPSALYFFVHEMNHFVNYVLQKVPFNVILNISLTLSGKEAKKT